MGQTCDYCGNTQLAYELERMRGNTATRCIPCLAVERGQKQFSLPFDAWLDQDDIEPPEGDAGPDFEPFDPRMHDYKTARAWFKILARIRSDEPILKRDPDETGAVFEDTREFLVNVMGSDAHKRPSELAE